MIVAVAVALVVGWLRRPAALEVAIRADLALRLKQRLSTAWEFMTVRGEDALAERLAAQAVKAGLPAIPGTGVSVAGQPLGAARAAGGHGAAARERRRPSSG